MKYLQVKQQGIGLIEVLISTVVIAIGLLSLASLEVGFLSSSGENKARAEALILAEKQVEAFKNNIDRVAYDAILSSDGGLTTNDAANPIAGENANFSRSWTVTNNNWSSPPRKKISVLVSWDGNGDGSIGANEKVNVVTEIAWINPEDSALYADQQAGGTGGTVPSPRQNASEDVSAASEDVIGTDLAIDTVAGVTGVAGADQQLQVTPDGTALILSQVAYGSFFYTATHVNYPAKIEAGVIAVFLCNDVTSTCTHVQNHFGGVVHRVRGLVYSTSGNLASTRVVWTSSGVHACYNGVVDTGTTPPQRAYECVYAGNCDATTAGTRTASLLGDNNHDYDTGCFTDSVVSDTQITERRVGPGGEYGDIGLIGLIASGGNTEQVCFMEDGAEPDNTPLLTVSGSNVLNENYIYSVTKRFYTTRRVVKSGSINLHRSEGINRSYSGHDFFIVDRANGASANNECHDEMNSAAKAIPPRKIFRGLNQGTTNTIVATEGYYSASSGTSHTIVGQVTANNATKLRLFIADEETGSISGSCYLNNNISDDNATLYACVVPPSTSEVKIIGSSQEYKTDDPAVFAECTATVAVGVNMTSNVCNWSGGFSDTFVDGVAAVGSCTTSWGSTVLDSGSVDAYLTASVSFGSTCSSETQTCSSGTLSGTYTYASCTVDDEVATGSCTTPWGSTIVDSSSVSAYLATSVAFGSTCTVETRACSSGTLSGSYTNESCTVDTAASCTTPWGVIIASGASVDAHLTPSVTFGSTCTTESRTCSNGVLSGSYSNQSCTIDAAICIAPNIINMSTTNSAKIALVDAAINTAGFTVGTKTAVGGGGGKKVKTQSPGPGVSVDCSGSLTIDYTYKP